MKALAAVASMVVLSACAVGPPSPPALSYASMEAQTLAYDYTDTSSVSVSMMGQSLQVRQTGTARYGVRLDPEGDGLVAEFTVEALTAEVEQPMGGGMRFDESSIRGELVFTLDGRGNATVRQQPEVDAEVSQLFSGLDIAHTFFPALPGRPISPGDVWVDTVSYEGAEGAGSRKADAVVEYEAVGDTLVGGKSLLLIEMSGTMTLSADVTMAGMTITQDSELEVGGHVLWDVASRRMVEAVRTASGEGTVDAPIAPAAIPISVTSVRHVRLRTP
jgi:hypothetical protein